MLVCFVGLIFKVPSLRGHNGAEEAGGEGVCAGGSVAVALEGNHEENEEGESCAGGA